MDHGNRLQDEQRCPIPHVMAALLLKTLHIADRFSRGGQCDSILVKSVLWMLIFKGILFV